RIPAGGERAGDPVPETVDRRSPLLALLGGERAQRLEQGRDRATAPERRDTHGFERALVGGGGNSAEELGFQGSKIGHCLPQLRQRRVLASSGLTKGRPCACAAIHSSLTRIHQRACVSASLMSIKRGSCTRPSRWRTTTSRSWPRKVCMNGLISGASGLTQPGDAQKIWCTSVASSVTCVIAGRPTTAWRSPCTSSMRNPGSSSRNL